MFLSPYLPWLDCIGGGFSRLWDRIYDILSEAVAKTQGGGVSGLAALPSGKILELLPWEDVVSVLPPSGDFGDLTVLHHRVLRGELHPKHLGGHCHLGIVMLKYLVGRAHEVNDPGKALDNFTQAWELLMYPLGDVATFDLMESSRWASFFSRDMLLRASASLEVRGGKFLEGVPETSILALLKQDCLPSWRWTAPAIEQPSRSVLGGAGRADQDAAAWRRNLTAVAISTHAAVLEPVASLRAQLSSRGARLLTHFLGVLHPGSSVPCELLPQDSRCSRVHGWGDDAQHYLYELGDMRSEAFRRPGFMPELSRRLELLHRRHVRGRADLVVCAHPFLLCALLRPLTRRFMLVYLTPTPLTLVPEADRPWVLALLAALAEAHAATAVLAASRLYALHALYQAGARVQAVRPSGLYVAERHRWRPGGPQAGRFFLWAMSGTSQEFVVAALGLLKEGRRQGVPWLREAEVGVKELLDPPFAAWEYLAGVRCVVLLPWDLQLTVFPELYALAVPLVLPTAEYVASYALRVLERWSLTFWAVNARFEGRLPGPQALRFAEEPWTRLPPGRGAGDLLSAHRQFLYWFRASDFEHFGHTLRFASLPEMLWHAAGTPPSELAAVSRAMRTEWAEARDAAAAVYEAVARRVVDWVGAAPPVTC